MTFIDDGGSYNLYIALSSYIHYQNYTFCFCSLSKIHAKTEGKTHAECLYSQLNPRKELLFVKELSPLFIEL